MKAELKKALNKPLWESHKIGNTYKIDGNGNWEIVYYPIFECGRTGKEYSEPRALMQNIDKEGFFSKEVPLRYLNKWTPTN